MYQPTQDQIELIEAAHVILSDERFDKQLYGQDLRGILADAGRWGFLTVLQRQKLEKQRDVYGKIRRLNESYDEEFRQRAFTALTSAIEFLNTRFSGLSVVNMMKKARQIEQGKYFSRVHFEAAHYFLSEEIELVELGCDGQESYSKDELSTLVAELVELMELTDIGEDQDE